MGLADTDEEEEDEEEEEEEISLKPENLVTIEGTDYYMVKAYGLKNILFSVGSGECGPEMVGKYDEENGEIIELSFEDD